MKLFDPEASGVVKAFVWFSIVVISVDLSWLVVPALTPMHERLIEYGGWVPSMPYLFTVPNVISPRNMGGLRRALRFSAWLLFVFAAMGAGAFIYLGGPQASDNPYLRASIVILVWTGAVPVVWGYLLYREASLLTPGATIPGHDRH